jgi:hypothetical protein
MKPVWMMPICALNNFWNMKNFVIRFVAIILVASILFSGCATILGGAKTKIRVKEGFPPNADVYLDGNYMGTAPCKLKVHKTMKNAQHHIDIKAQGYETQTVTTNRKFSAGFFLLDICTGVVWTIFDFATGNIYRQTPRKIHYKLVPKDEMAPAEKQIPVNVNNSANVVQKEAVDNNSSASKNDNKIPVVHKSDNKDVAVKENAAPAFKVGDEVYYANMLFWYKLGRVTAVGNDGTYMIDKGDGLFVKKKSQSLYKKGLSTDEIMLKCGDSVLYGSRIFGYKRGTVVSVPDKYFCIVETADGKILMKKLAALVKE